MFDVYKLVRVDVCLTFTNYTCRRMSDVYILVRVDVCLTYTNKRIGTKCVGETNTEEAA